MFDPAGVPDRTPEEVLKAAMATSPLHNGPLRGVCNVCSGPMTASFDICEDHADEGVCPICDLIFRAAARFRCSVCKASHLMSPPALLKLHPAGIAFYWDHDVPLLYEGDVRDMPGYPERDVSERVAVTVISGEPPRVRVTIDLDDNELQAEIDEDLAVTVLSETD